MQKSTTAAPEELSDFLRALRSLPRGHSLGHYNGRRWSTSLEEAGNGSRFKLFAEELGGKDIVSFNLYMTGAGKPLLKPCEMSAEKVIGFVLGYKVAPPDD